MLPEEVKRFRDSNRQLSSKQIVDACERRIETLKSMWASSPSNDRDGREEYYREYRGIVHALNELVRGWE
jgi:hypothetical protein